jgi:hypothetical protein
VEDGACHGGVQRVEHGEQLTRRQPRELAQRGMNERKDKGRKKERKNEWMNERKTERKKERKERKGNINSHEGMCGS